MLSSHRGGGFQEVFCFPGGARLTPAVAPLCPVPAEHPWGGLSTGACPCVLFRPHYVMTRSRKVRAPGRRSAMTVDFGSSVLADLAAREPNASRGEGSRYVDPFTAGPRSRTLCPLEDFEGRRLLQRQTRFFGGSGSREAMELGLSHTAIGWDTVLRRKWTSGEDHSLALLLGSSGMPVVPQGREQRRLLWRN